MRARVKKIAAAIEGRFFYLPAFICPLLIFSSCGYSVGKTESLSALISEKTITLPYIKEDRFGILTAALVKQLTSRIDAQYRISCADLSLQVSLIYKDDENIGFRYDRKKNGKRTKYVVPVESRIIEAAEVSLVDNATGEVLRGPFQIAAKLEFDHDYYISSNVNIFSLGQLTDVDDARDAALTPLYERLAEKIVDTILDCW